VLRRRVVLVLVIAVAMGLLTAYLVYKSVNKPAVQQAETEEILVARANIGLGEAMTPQHVQLTPWPKPMVPPGSLRAVKDVEGRTARASMVAGEPVLDSKLTAAGGGGLMPVLIPTGKRAISILVEQATQKSGFVVPNSRVDVLVTMAPKGSNDTESRIVLQDVTVLAADQTVEMKDNKPVAMTTVTMALSPEETERLALAQNQGRVTLALRNIQDTAVISTPGVNTAQLMGRPAPAPSTAKKAAPPAAPSAAKRASKPAVKMAEVSPSSTKTSPSPPPLPSHTVSVIRGVASTDTVFVQDPDRGWLETPGKK
jgi:pilus assembly protein CpaB